MQAQPSFVVPAGDEQQEDLREQLKQLVAQRAQRTRLRNWLYALAAVLALMVPLVAVLDVALPFVIALAVYALASYVGGFLIAPDLIDWQIRDAEIKLQLSADAAALEQMRALKLFKSHEFELQRYYSTTLRHSRIVLWVGILCVFLGFIIIGGAAWLVFRSPASGGNVTEIVVGVLGAIGGILANYVAAIYLQMHAATSRALSDFHGRLVITNHVYLGNYIASLVEDRALREKTLAAMAEELAKQ